MGLEDALHNVSKTVTRGDTRLQAYGRGILVGIVSALVLEMRRPRAEIMAQLKRDMPTDVDPECVPPGWPL